MHFLQEDDFGGWPGQVTHFLHDCRAHSLDLNQMYKVEGYQNARFPLGDALVQTPHLLTLLPLFHKAE